MAYTNYERWKRIPLTESPRLSVVIPAYNEAERIVPTIGAISSHLCDGSLAWELIVADDGSTDGTADLVENLGLANLRLLRAERNGGKGSAVRRGMLAARGDYLLFTDADNSTPIEELGKLLAQLVDNGAQVAVGSRAGGSADEQQRAPLRRIISGGLRHLVRHALRLQVVDTQCGFKLYTRAAGQMLHGLQTMNGFSFDLELLFLAQKLGYTVAEVPVTWIDAPGSKVRAFKEATRFLRDVLRIRANNWRGLYDAQAHPVTGHCHLLSSRPRHAK